MATVSPRRRRPAVTLISFFIVLVILVAIMALSRTWTPKLGLDLRGGTTITLTAVNSTGTGTVDQNSLEQARTIIEQRVNSLGVGEASVTTTGNNQIQVSVPNVQGDTLVEMVGQTAQLEFRRVYQVDQAVVYPDDQATELPSVPTLSPLLSVASSANPIDALPAADQILTFSFTVTNAGTGQASNIALKISDFSGSGSLSDITCPQTTLDTNQSQVCTATYVVTAADSAAGSITATVTASGVAPDGTTTVTSSASSVTVPMASDTTSRLAQLSDQLAWTPPADVTTDFSEFQCSDVVQQVWDQPFFACTRVDPTQGATTAASKYLLGPRLIEGSLVDTAAAGIPQNQLTWVVTLNFDSLGAQLFSAATTALSGATSPTDQFAIVLDGKVISALRVNEPIPNGSAQITGSFNQQSATNLANVLKYGALPLSFEVSNVDTVSATLGGDQLTAGLIAGAVGLLLVVIYSIIYYRGLTVVVFSSLLMAGGLVYTLIVLLGEAVSFALSLPGLAGAIVAIGVTADSFVIFFERVRDEAREGRSIKTAVETGWDKARRTIVVADTVSLLSAVILYILSIGTIKGFAFTLGLTTLVDLAMIFFFTKPLVSLLVKTEFFGRGHKGSGFEAEHLGIAATRRPRPRALATVKEPANV